MSTFVRLSEKQRKLFFTKLKENISSSWDNFYPKYNRSRAMFFNYMSGKYDLPHELFVKWKKIAEVELENIKKIEKQKYIQKEIAKGL